MNTTLREKLEGMRWKATDAGRPHEALEALLDLWDAAEEGFTPGDALYIAFVHRCMDPRGTALEVQTPEEAAECLVNVACTVELHKGTERERYALGFMPLIEGFLDVWGVDDLLEQVDAHGADSGFTPEEWQCVRQTALELVDPAVYGEEQA